MLFSLHHPSQLSADDFANNVALVFLDMWKCVAIQLGLSIVDVMHVSPLKRMKMLFRSFYGIEDFISNILGAP